MIVYQKNNSLSFNVQKSCLQNNGIDRLAKIKREALISCKYAQKRIIVVSSRFFQFSDTISEKYSYMAFEYMKSLLQKSEYYYHDSVYYSLELSECMVQIDSKIEFYKMLYPAITNFIWDMQGYSKDTKLLKNPQFDLKSLCPSYIKIKSILEHMPSKFAKEILYELYPQFAIFYYEIVPYMKLEEVASINIGKIKHILDELEEINQLAGINLGDIPKLYEMVDQAKTNTEILQLVRKI